MQNRAHIESIVEALRGVLGQLDELEAFEAAIDLDSCINKLFDQLNRPRPQEDIDALLDVSAFNVEPAVRMTADL